MLPMASIGPSNNKCLWVGGATIFRSSLSLCLPPRMMEQINDILVR